MTRSKLTLVTPEDTPWPRPEFARELLEALRSTPILLAPVEAPMGVTGQGPLVIAGAAGACTLAAGACTFAWLRMRRQRQKAAA